MKSFTRLAFSTVLFACSALAAENAMADNAGVPPPPEHYRAFDRVQMTRGRLEDLKAKLNLGESQMPAWNAWSAEVVSDVKELDKEANGMHRDWREGRQKDLTIPERMERQEAHLRSRIGWMQKRLDLLEAGRKNTETFYAALTRDQRTIFDLFWEKNFRRRHAMRDFGSKRREMPEDRGPGGKS